VPEIRDIQEALNPLHQTAEIDSVPAYETSDFVFTIASNLTLADVQASLPPKAQADALVSAYFNAGHFQVCKFFQAPSFKVRASNLSQ
jgi:hypothetical protein